MAEEIISMEFDFGDGVEKLENMTQAGKRFGETLEGIRATVDETIPGMTAFLDMSEQSFAHATRSIDLTQRKLNEGKIPAYSQDMALTSLRNQRNSMAATIEDVRVFAELSREVDKLSKGIPSVRKMLVEELPPLMTKARSIAEDKSRAGRSDPVSTLTTALITQIKNDPQHNRLRARLSEQNIGSEVLQTIAKYAVMTSVPQYHRRDYMESLGGDLNVRKHIYPDFRSMLPPTFAKIPAQRQYRTKQAFEDAFGNDTMPISVAEMEKLRDIVKENRYMADAAVATGAAKKINGQLLFNGHLNRGMVNAIAGNLMEDIVSGAKGMPMYGIQNVEDSDNWTRIARKTNKQMTGALRAARMMQEHFGEWLAPDYYTDSQLKDLAGTMQPGLERLRRIDKIGFSPRAKSFEVAQYTADDLARGLSWNNGGQYDKAEDYHHIAVDDSIQLRKIMQYGSGNKPHNSYIDDVVYFKIDERLADPNASDETRTQIKADIAKVWEQGFSVDGPNGSKLQYVATRVNPKMGIELIRKEIHDKIIADDPSFFSAGFDKTSFNPRDFGGSAEKAWKSFAAAMEYRNKNATPGESLEDLFGVDFFADGRTPNIAVVDIPSLDGASMIHNRYVPTGFQGRMTGVKSALMPLDIGKMSEKYGKYVEFMRVTGDGKVAIDDSVDLILNKADIKNFEERFAGKSYDEIVRTITEDLRKDGMSALRTYGDADTPTRWISAQLAQTMQMTPDDVAMFNRAFREEMLGLNSYNYVKDTVFAQDSEMHDILEKNPQMFHTRIVQDRIRDYRMSMLHRKSQGDLLIPREIKAHKAMAAPWVVDVFNKAVEAAGGEIPEDMRTLSLLGGDSEADSLKERVVFLKALTESLGLSRYPAAPGSIQLADNAAVGLDEKGKVSFATRFHELANEIGLSADALYFAPGSKLMQYMQSQDFDGDVNEIIEFSRNPETTEEALMQKIFEVTMRHGREILGYTEGIDTDARTSSLKRSTLQTKAVDAEKLKEKIYRIAGEGSGEDVAQFIEEYMKSSVAMGVPNAVLRNAYQMQMNRDVALAMYDAIEQYDTNSTQGKKAITRLTSAEERDVLGKYKPFSEFFHMMNKATDETGEIDYAKLQNSNIWKINLPSLHASGSMRSALLSRYMAKQMGLDINMGYDWDRFFAAAGDDLDIDAGTGELTPVGRMQSALRDVYKGFLDAEYLFLSDEDKVALDALKQDALNYELARVEQDIVAGRLSDDEKKITGKPSSIKEQIARRRIGDKGGMVIDNMGLYAATESNIGSDSYYLMSDLVDYGFADQDVLSHAGIADRYLGENRVVVSDPGSKRILTPGSISRNRGLLQTIRETWSVDQMKGRLNDLSFSPTSLAAFASNPEEWILDRFADQGTRPKQADSDSIKLGKATEDAIQGFMRLRQQAAQSGRMLTQEELEKAKDRAVADLDAYLKDGVSGEGGYAGLSESAYKDITAGRGRTGETYMGVKKWLQESLLDFMPESEYMVTATERSRKYEHAELGKTLPTENNPNEDALRMTGRTDLEFVSRKTGKKTVADIKVHDVNASPETLYMNILKATNQLQSYALSDEARSGLIGEEIEALKILLPALGDVKPVDASEEALAQRASAISEAIKVIQSLPESGMNPIAIKAAGQRVSELLYGVAPNQGAFLHKVYTRQDELAAEERSKERMSGMIDKSSVASIGGVLTLHEDFKDSMDSLARVEKFANAKMNGDNRPTYDQWAGGYRAIDDVGRDAESLRSQGMLAEADRLDMTRNALKNNLDVALIKSATADYEKFYDTLHAINTDMQVSKSASGRIEFYRSMAEQATLAAQAHSELNAQIKKIDEDIAAKRSDANSKRKEAENETDEEKKNQLLEDAARIDAYIGAQKARRTAFEEAAENASKKKPQVDAEYAAFKSKFVSDTFSYYDEVISGFGDIRSGGRKSGLTSIAEDVEAYVKSVRQTVADLNQMNKDGLFETDDDKKRYESMLEQATAAYSPEAQQEYAKTLITSSLSDAQSRMLALRSSISDTPISTEDQIKMAVAKKSEEMKMAKMDLQKRLGAADLSDDERNQYNDLLSFYDSFDSSAYQTRLTEQARLDNELQEARRARRTERLLVNGRKLQRDPFGIRSNNFLDRAEERRDAAVDRYDNLIENYKVEIKKREATMASSDVNSDAYKKAADDVKKLTEALHSAEDASKSLAGAGGIASAAFAQMGESVTRVIQQFGRQMFHQAANEVKRFVQQYNADMTTIQMITLKTDEEISNLGADLIDTAIDLKVSVSDVTTAASEIYRQGLTDEEVDVRLEDTMKFSKVAGIKAEEASKILTTAMTNGLVETSEEAMDALVALDDSVATSASEIAKGMQKSAASAKEAGMSYQELVTSLAIITSRTQLGGSTAGTALSTLMYRLFRVNKDDGFYDENGNYIAKTDTSDALANLGVDLYDDSGNFRGPYQILVDIAKNWENANDTKRSMLLSTLGAGRQRSNMATLIQGLAEDGGALAESYIDLASNSQGIADEKYLIYLESLDAALNSVQSSFDKLIASFNVGETATGFLNLISNMLQGLVLFNEATDGVVFGIIGITTAMVALGAAVHANPLFWGITAAGAAIAGITSAIGHAIDDKKNDGLSIEDASERMEEIRREEAEIQTLITRMEELNGKTNRTTSEQAELDAGMQQLSSSFSVVGAAMEAATSGAQNYTAAIDAAKTAVANLTAQQKKSVIESSINALGDRFLDDASVYADENHPLYAFATPENAGATIFRAYGQTHGIAKLIENSPEYKDLYESLGWLTKDGDPLARGAGPESWKPYYDSFLKADKTSQQRIYKRALLQEYENIGYDLTKLFPEHVFDQMVKNGHFTAEKMSETFGASGLGYLDKDELMNILRTGKFSSAWMQEVYGGGEDATYGGIVPDIIAHVYDIIGDGLLRGQYDDMQSEGIKDAIESVIISWIEAFFPDADTDALSAALQRRILEATEGKTDEKSWVAAAVGTANEVVNTVFKIDEDGNFVYDEKALDSFIDDPDKRKWEYFDEYGAWRKGFSQDEARQKLLESGRKVEGVKEVFSYSVGEQAGLTKEEAEDAVAKNKEKINKAQDQSEELAAPTAPYYVEGVPYDSLADAKEAVFMKFRSENADKSLSDVIRAFGEQEKMLLSSFIRPGTGTKPMYGGVEYDTYEQALAQYEADKQAIASQVKGLPVNILRKHDGYEYQGKKYTTEADAIIDAAIDQGYLRSYVVSTPPTNENALSAASKLLQDAGDVYKSTNKTAFEVDALIEEMISENVGSFADLMSGVNGNKLKGLKNALSLEDGRLGFLLSKGVTDQGDGSFSFDESFWNEFYTLLTRNSYSYQGTFDPTRNEEANAAQKALNDLLSGKKYEDVSSADLETILSATDLYPLIRSGSLTGENLQYANMLLSNYRYGMDGLSQMQQSYGANTVLDAIMEGRAAELIGSTTEGTRSAYMSGVSSMPELLAAAEAIESFNISGVNSLSDFLELDVDSDTYAEVARQLKSIGINAEDIDDVLRDVQDEVTKLEKKYGDLSDEISDGAKKWRGSTKDLASAQTELNRTLTAAANNQYYRQLFRKGDRSPEVLQAISEQVHIDKDAIEDNMDIVLETLDTLESADIESVESSINAMFEGLGTFDEIAVQMPDVVAEGGSVDLTTVANQLVGDAQAQVQDAIRRLQMISAGGVFDFSIDENGNASIKFRVTDQTGLGGLGAGRKSGGGGGGGGGKKKSAAETLLEKQDHESTVTDHIIKMIQYEQTMYKNADELTNYGIMLQHEIDEEKRQVEVKKQNIAALKEEIAKTEQLSDDWYSLRDAIMKAEEELKDLQNTIDENLDALKENEQAILKLHTDLEQTVKAEIENRLQREEDMLAGSVSLQETILEAIRQRYRDEWELMQEDIEKKKEALQEEISLIDERLQRRKDAEDEAEKHEQLAEYKRQLAMISLDSTRTADQAELRKKIAELEKEIAWDVAEDEAEAQKQGLQDQIDAYDEYVEEHQKELDDLLENANNFAEEVNGVMRLNQDELFAWLKENVQEYANSLGDAQKQMLNTWEDTFKQMKGITDTYWADIAKILSSKESFIEYMKGSQEYINASEDEKKQLIYGWELMYDTYINANKVSDEAVDYTHDDTDYTTSTDTSASSGSTTKYRSYYTVYDAKTGAPYQGYGVGSTQEEADRVAAKLKQDKLNSGLYVATKPNIVEGGGLATGQGGLTPNTGDILAPGSFSEGGYVDYTGLAMVHGSPSRPEAFLSADDTSMIRSLLDSWKYIKTKPVISNIDSLFGGRGDTNVGEVNVVINQAELKEDADFEEVARRVGEAFTKELAKQGFNTAAYAL